MSDAFDILRGKKNTTNKTNNFKYKTDYSIFWHCLLYMGLLILFIWFCIDYNNFLTNKEPENYKTWNELSTYEKNQVYNDMYKIQYNSRMNTQNHTIFKDYTK